MTSTNKKKLFYTLFFNDLLSDFGDTLYYLALMTYVIELDNSQLALSLITLSETLPILFKALMGHLADRVTTKLNVIVQTQFLRFILYILIGYFVAFKPALWIILIISFINFVSDLLGQLENGLYLPVEMSLIDDDDRESVFATTQSIAATAQIVFKIIGAGLVTLISYQKLAFANALTFLICACLTLMIQKQVKQASLLIANDSEEDNEANNFLTSLRQAFSEIRKTPLLKDYLLTITILNGLFAITSPLIVAIMAKNVTFVFINSATTIALVSTVMTLSAILGNIASQTLFKSVSLRKLIYLSTLLLPLLFLGLRLQQLLPTIIILAIMGMVSGAINPKFYGFLMGNLSMERIGILTGSIGTILQGGIILSQLLFSFLIVLVPINAINTLFLIAALLLPFYLTLKGEQHDPVTNAQSDF